MVFAMPRTTGCECRPSRCRNPSRCPRSSSTRKTIRSCPPGRCPAPLTSHPQSRSSSPTPAATSPFRPAPSPATSTGFRDDWCSISIHSPVRIDPSIHRERDVEYPKEIFKAYDIRGIVGKTFTAEIVEAIGHAIGSEAVARGQKEICIGRDGRLSGPDLAAALARGIRKAGIGVVDLGMVATPMTYFAAYQLGTNSAVMVTGSHNPPDYNGLKMVLGGETLSGDSIQVLRERLVKNDLVHGDGGYRQHDIAGEYLARIVSDVKLARPMKIIVDCGNGVPGAFAPKLYRDMGCQVEELFCEVDGNFPNHHPDPSQPKNLQDLIAALKTSDAEIGLAFDGDGDRLGVVTKDGSIIFPDRQLMLFADDVLSRNPGAEIIFDVKSTRN